MVKDEVIDDHRYPGCSQDSPAGQDLLLGLPAVVDLLPDPRRPALKPNDDLFQAGRDQPFNILLLDMVGVAPDLKGQPHLLPVSAGKLLHPFSLCREDLVPETEEAQPGQVFPGLFDLGNHIFHTAQAKVSPFSPVKIAEADVATEGTPVGAAAGANQFIGVPP